MMALFRLIVFLLIILLVPVSAFTQQKKGEIININYKYKIAFTDLTEGDVSSGELVMVRLGDGKLVKLEVVEAYPVMAKLAIATDAESSVSAEDFAKISVGAIVTPNNQNGAYSKSQKITESVLKSKRDIALEQSLSRSSIEVLDLDQPKLGNVQPVVIKRNTLPSVSLSKNAGTVVTSSAGGTAQSVSERGMSEQAIVQGVANTTSEEQINKLTNNAVNLSEHISRLLTDKVNLEAIIKDKDSALYAEQQKSDKLSAANVVLDGQVKALEMEVSRLKAQSADSLKEKKDLEQKLLELKRKLSRMVDIVNKNVKAYE